MNTEQYIGTLRYRERTGNPLDPTRDEVLSRYDIYQQNKLTFLNECYSSLSTMNSYWTLYNTNVHFDEVNRNKDVMYLNTEEIMDLIRSTFGMDTTKASLASFLNMYYRWAYSKGKIDINPYLGIQTSKIKANSKRMLESKLYGQKAFYQLCEDMRDVTKLPNIIPFVLARYGIAGEKLYYMRYLKWEDIDREKMVVNIIHRYQENGKNIEKHISTLPIDDNFIKWIYMAKAYTETTEEELRHECTDGNFKKKNIVRYEDFGYVLKKAMDAKNNESDDEKVNKFNTIYNRAKVACSVLGIKRIAFKDLVRTRQLELLLEIRKHRRLTSKDFDNIVEIFTLEDEKIIENKSHILRKRYEELTNDRVVLKNRKHPDDDDNSLEIATALINDLGLEIIY